jgi:lipopolysaccharide/colanic/teichoic acid biosynthesis glycosyltransferase
LKDLIRKEAGERVYEFITQHVELDGKGLVVSTSIMFNILNAPKRSYRYIINLKRINDIRFLNKFFEAVNEKLYNEGIFIGCVETYPLRKKKILKKYIPPINYLVYTVDFIFKRIVPKLPILKKIYFSITQGNNRVLSRAETFGRLYSCGFILINEIFINGYHYWTARKVKEPLYPNNPTYGLFVRLQRIGKDGNVINVYKLRTMHAYSEYLQDYIFKQNDLEEGGKFREDFRITTLGKFFRVLWLDELPMFINVFIKNNMKIVGVRPLSQHYYELYDTALRKKRIQFKPGLIPPYYAQFPTPRSLEEIQKNEKEYLEAYQKRPFLTDLRYFFKALINIVFRRVRSK